MPPISRLDNKNFVAEWLSYEQEVADRKFYRDFLSKYVDDGRAAKKDYEDDNPTMECGCCTLEFPFESFVQVRHRSQRGLVCGNRSGAVRRGPPLLPRLPEQLHQHQS